MTSLKLKTARTLKWNTVDRLASQVLYGVVGVVLANVLSQEDFGLVGALLVFQSFAIIFADSGFGAALLQKKTPTEEDYSTVFWFNLVVSVAIYWILWFGSPLIADIFHDERLIPLSKGMFLTFVLNALAIVQTNRLMKRMDVKMIALSNVVAQSVGGALGICLALMGYGAWALVWQSVALAGIKTALLWVTGGWWPTCWIKRDSLRAIWRIGLSVFSSSMLNTLFLTIYSFVIGAFYSLRSLGVYSQADKWSKMGSASLSQVLTASFVPLLSRVQDSADDFRRYVRKINRFTAFILFPSMIGLAAVGAPLFHTLFGNKWDAAIILFQILTIRGVFVVLVSLYGNYMLAKGYGRRLFMIEVVKDVAIAVAILCTVFYRSVDLLVWGQLWASVLTWIVIVCMAGRATGYGIRAMVMDLVPFAVAACAMWAVCAGLSWLVEVGWSGAGDGWSGVRLQSIVQLCVEVLGGGVVYLLVMKLGRFPELDEAAGYLFGRFRKTRR
jgi:O-antigen/teichoic acid export membrane protein